MSGIWMISDCRHFWDIEEMSEYTQIASVQEDGSNSTKTPNLNTLQGKKILLLIHEAKASKSDILDFYTQAARQLCRDEFYDLVVGYLWPGGMDDLRSNHQLVKRIRLHLIQLNELAAKVDGLADGIGNRLIFEALKGESDRILLQNLYSLAPAVEEESFENGDEYYSSAQGCKGIYLFHSKKDPIPPFLHKIAFFDEARKGKEADLIEHLPRNIQLIDCTGILSPRQQIQSVPEVYAYIRKRLKNETPAPESAPEIKLLPNYRIEVLRRSSLTCAKIAATSRRLFASLFGQ